VGLPLAILGLFTPIAVVLPWLVAWPSLAVCGFRWIQRGRTKTATVTSWSAVAIAIGFGVFVGVHSSEHLLTDRDPGVYFITGKWLATHGDLLYDQGLPEEIQPASPNPLPQGLYAAPNGKAYFQFQHAPAVVLATANWIGGNDVMFKAMALVAVIALLGLYLVSRGLAGPVYGLAPVALAAVHPAFVHVGKDGYSEFLALAFVSGAFVLWIGMGRGSIQWPRWPCFGAGLLLGAVTMARIDGWLLAAGFLMGLTYQAVTSRGRVPRQRDILVFILGFMTTATLGLLDLTLRSPPYLSAQQNTAGAMMGAVAVIAVVAVVASSPTIVERFDPRQRLWLFAPVVVAIDMAVLGLYGLLVRPWTVTVHGEPIGNLVAIQEREGLAVDPTRTYAEMSFEWLARYQGYIPIVVGILLTSLAGYVVLRRRDLHRVPVFAGFVAVAAAYLWRPSITPDHLWSLRRFVPVVLPLGLAFTALGVRLVVRRFPTVLVKVGFLGILAVAVAQSTSVGWPVAPVRTHIGMVAATESVCALLPPNAVVLFDNPIRNLAGAVRTVCDVPVTTSADATMVDDIVQAGMAPVMMSSGIVCTTQTIGSVERLLELPERTLSKAPSGPESEPLIVRLTTATGPSEAVRGPAPPSSADGVLLVQVDTTWVPDDGSSVVAALGGYESGMWLEYRSSGIVELWVTTDRGQFGVDASPPINDGQPRIVGGYVLDGVLHGTCGGLEIESRTVPGTPHFEDSDVEVKPVTDRRFGDVLFEGDVSIIQGDVDPALIVSPP